jgi:hypothetical protein
MRDPLADVLFDAHVRVRVARGLAELLCAQRLDRDCGAPAVLDETLQRLCQQLDLFSRLTDAGAPWNAVVCDPDPAPVSRLLHDVLPAGPHD